MASETVALDSFSLKIDYLFSLSSLFKQLYNTQIKDWVAERFSSRSVAELQRINCWKRFSSNVYKVQIELADSTRVEISLKVKADYSISNKQQELSFEVKALSERQLPRIKVRLDEKNENYITDPHRKLVLLNKLSELKNQELYLLKTIRDSLFIACSQVEDKQKELTKINLIIKTDNLVVETILNVILTSAYDSGASLALKHVFSKLFKSRAFLRHVGKGYLSDDGKAYKSMAIDMHVDKKELNHAIFSGGERKDFNAMLTSEDGMSLLDEEVADFINSTVSFAKKGIQKYNKSNKSEGKNKRELTQAYSGLTAIKKSLLDTTRDQEYFSSTLYDSIYNQIVVGLFKEKYEQDLLDIVDANGVKKLYRTFDFQTHLLNDIELMLWHVIYPLETYKVGLHNDLKTLKYVGMSSILSSFFTEYLMRRNFIVDTSLSQSRQEYRFNSEYYLGPDEFLTKKSYMAAKESALKEVDSIEVHELRTGSYNHNKLSEAELKRLKEINKKKVLKRFEHSDRLWANQENGDLIMRVRILAFMRKYISITSRFQKMLLLSSKNGFHRALESNVMKLEE